MQAQKKSPQINATVTGNITDRRNQKFRKYNILGNTRMTDNVEILTANLEFLTTASSKKVSPSYGRQSDVAI